MSQNNFHCPICFEDSDIIVLSCNHPICKKCICQLTSQFCPLCRSTIDCLDEETIEKINQNRLQQKTEWEEQERSEIIENIQNDLERLNPDVLVKAEVNMALKYLLEQGVPRTFLPEKIIAKIQHNTYTQGNMFQLIISHTLNYVKSQFIKFISTYSTREDIDSILFGDLNEEDEQEDNSVFEIDIYIDFI